MYTSLLLVALASGVTPTTSENLSPRWLDDYAAALTLGNQDGKPLAVFIGSGESGWEKLSRDGKIGKDTRALLGAQYVCLYIDTGRDAGNQLARAFNVADGVGLVISNRAGDKQAFHHRGDLKEATLEYYLKRFADPNFVIRTTETNPPERGSSQSFYQPSAGGSGSTGRNC